jgi:hypothetical protein
MTDAAVGDLSLGITQIRPSNSDGSACSLPPNIDVHGLIADCDFHNESCPESFGQLSFLFFGIEYADGIGLVLRQLADGNFERIGTCQCSCLNLYRTKDLETSRANVLSYINSLPIKEVRLV